MTTLKEATSTVHRQAEQTRWARLLVTGKITEQQYAAHLVNLLPIHKAIEERIFLPANIIRSKLIEQDLVTLNITSDILSATKSYIEYLSNLSDQKIWAHIYVHYLGELYGGQYIKKVIKFPTRHLEFANIEESIAYIREFSKLAEHDEAIKAFEFTIKLYEQLWEENK